MEKLEASALLYMPILKWKQGEKIALRHVPATDRSLTLPLIELLQPDAPLKEYVDKVGKDLRKANADTWPIAIDTRHVSLKANPSKVVAAICASLTKRGLLVLPVVTPSMISTLADEADKLAQYRDIVLRIPIGSVLSSQIPPLIAETSKAIGRPRLRIHIVLDLESIVGLDIKDVMGQAESFVKAALDCEYAITVTLSGGSFPFNLIGFTQGTHFIQRVEWGVWTSLKKKYDELRFGDYAVTNPKPLEDLDPLKINPSAAIRYAHADKWMLLKAGGTRTSGYGQYNQLCKLLILDPKYSSQNFSYGDAQYHLHAQPGMSSGNLSSWRRDATSHHLALTVRNCAKLCGIAI